MSLAKLSRSLTGAVSSITSAKPLLITVVDDTTGDNQTNTILGWSRTLGIPLATLRYRYLAGWTPEQILGRASRPRDRTAEQSTLTSQALVIIVDSKNQPISRRTAAAALRISPKSLAQRLRHYRVPGQQTHVSLVDLYAGSRAEAAGLTLNNK